MIMENYTDGQLIVAYLAGEEKFLEILIKRYLKPIYSFACQYVGNSQEAEDITQEVFIKAWRSLKKFNQKKSFKTWIFAIAKNTCIDFFKKKKTIPFSNFENEEGENELIKTLADTDLLPDKLFERANMAQTLALAIGELSLKYRMVLLLRYNNNFTFQEIAKVSREPLNTIKSRYRRALILLRKLLTES